MKNTKNFASRWGFILASVGSAVGMANVWGFPNKLGSNGGGAFLLIYLLFVFIFSYVGLPAEFAMGRHAATGTLGAYEKAWSTRGKGAGKAGGLLGWLPLAGSLCIAFGYAVIVTYILKALVDSLVGTLMTTDTASWFGTFSSTPYSVIPYHIIVVVGTLLTLYLGAHSIEKTNKIMMPLFFVLFCVLLVRVAMLPGAIDGYAYLFMPRWEALANPQTWVLALGQAFFGLSLAGGGTLVYGSYLKKDVNVVSSARNVVVFSTLAAVLSAMVVVPAVFAFGADTQAGPPLLFIVLPQVFEEMPFGGLFCFVFFLAVACAAITSLVNLYEPPIEALQQQARLPRWAAVAIVAAVSMGVGAFIENGDAVSAWMDAVSIYAIPLGALIAAVMFFWVCPKGFASKQAQMGREKPVGAWFEFMGRYLFVPLTAIVIILGIVLGGIG